MHKGTICSQRVGLFTYFEWASVSSPVLNTAKYLAFLGYQVDLFVIPSRRFGIPTFADSSITVHVISTCRNPLTNIALLLKHALEKRRYLFVVGFDADGLIVANFFNILYNVPCIYHSLELIAYPARPEWKDWRVRLRKYLEPRFARKAAVICTQDENRASALARLTAADRGRILVVFNSSLGDPLPEKSSCLREMFGIADTSKVVLCIGSLMPETCTVEIIQSVDWWPDEYVLVVHGWIPSAEYEKIVKEEVLRRAGRVILSTDLVPDAEKHVLFQSADIGLAFYNPIDINLEYAAGAAGKIYDFMRAGVPIIGNALTGMKQLLEGNGVGVVVGDAAGIGSALATITQSYHSYRTAALRAYEDYNFEACYNKVLERIQDILEGHTPCDHP